MEVYIVDAVDRDMKHSFAVTNPSPILNEKGAMNSVCGGPTRCRRVGISLPLLSMPCVVR